MHNTLKEAQRYLQQDGSRQSWLDAPVDIARARAQDKAMKDGSRMG